MKAVLDDFLGNPCYAELEDLHQELVSNVVIRPVHLSQGHPLEQIWNQVLVRNYPVETSGLPACSLEPTPFPSC